MSDLPADYYERSDQLHDLLNNEPIEAVRLAREILWDTVGKAERLYLMQLRASILVDGGSAIEDRDAISEGLELFRELHAQFPTLSLAYNLANGLIAFTSRPSRNKNWLDHQERTREHRAEARRYLWKVAEASEAESSLKTQALTNLANQFSNSFRLSEAHDIRLAALQIDPENGVAAGTAARELLWLYSQGGCSELTHLEAGMLARLAHRHQDKIVQYAGVKAAKELAALASQFADLPKRSAHKDPFIAWVERERLTLGPTVELVDPKLGKLDWLMLPDILERDLEAECVPPPVFSMFNSLKSDYILARDLAWRGDQGDSWPATGRFSGTLDGATYGPNTSALILAHRTALDLLDKVAVTANHYFELGQNPKKIYFGNMWRESVGKKVGVGPLFKPVSKLIIDGATALYGLVELAEDYDGETGILRPQKNLRNAGTHRFVVLHDFGDIKKCRQASEIERHEHDDFTKDVLRALRVARSAIQMLALSITQHEKVLRARTTGFIGSLNVPDYE